METATRDSNEAPAATACARCHASDKATSATTTGRVVYPRCRRCGILWSIWERRASFRTQDARKVFDVDR